MIFIFLCVKIYFSYFYLCVYVCVSECHMCVCVYPQRSEEGLGAAFDKCLCLIQVLGNKWVPLEKQQVNTLKHSATSLAPK